MIEIKGKTFLTVRETAEMLGLKEPTVRKWVREGRLKAVKLGRAWVIDFEKFLIEQFGDIMPEEKGGVKSGRLRQKD